MRIFLTFESLEIFFVFFLKTLPSEVKHEFLLNVLSDFFSKKIESREELWKNESYVEEMCFYLIEKIMRRRGAGLSFVCVCVD